MTPKMMTVPTHVVAHLTAHCPGRTDEALHPAFGISYNTWRRIERGEANRASVVARLVDRVASQTANGG